MTTTSQVAPTIEDRYRHDGWFKSDRLLPRRALDVLRDRVEILGSERRPEVVYERGTRTVRAIHGCHLYDDVCARLVRLPALLNLAEQLLGEPVYVYQFKINLKQPREGAAWPWHQDYAFWKHEDGMPADNAVNVAVFLDDTDDHNGPLQIIPGSHRLGLIGADDGEQEPSGDWRNHVSVDLEYTVPEPTANALAGEFGLDRVVGPAGTVCTFHPSLVHSSSSNLSADRRGLLLVTYNAVSNSPPNPTRPEFLVSRDRTPLTPAISDTL